MGTAEHGPAPVKGMGLVPRLVLGLALAALVAACSPGAVPGVAPTPIPLPPSGGGGLEPNIPDAGVRK